jgi:hypothetical protein
MSDGKLAPTAKLRFLDRASGATMREVVLQQWWAPDVPSYMRDESQGEWRDVQVVRHV